ncbi:MAG: hypothetical protein AAB434_04330 [Planctomycetota bacterium]
MAALGAFVVTFGLFLGGWVLAQLLLSSVRARTRRAREAAEGLMEDVMVLVERGAVDRALQAAESHATVFGWALARVLAAEPASRAERAGELEKSWKSRPSGVPGGGYELVAALLALPGLAGAYLLEMYACMGSLDTLSDRLGVVVLAALGAVLGLWLHSSGVARIGAERRGLADSYREYVGKLMRALDPPPPGGIGPAGEVEEPGEQTGRSTLP